MTIASLRLRFPRLVIWGNMSSGFLQHATADQVREEGRRLVEESGGTRYFHGCSNAIVTGTPSANVEAMFSVR
jgi:uroporphyrinogen-III decarboxylase